MKTPALLFLLLGASIAGAGAQTYVNDTFTGATASGTGNGSTVTGAPGTWTVYSATAPTGTYYTVTADELGLRATNTANAGGSAAATGSTTVAFRGFDGGTTLTLGGLQVGEALQLSFDLGVGGITDNTVAGANAGGFSFGFLTNGTTAGNNSVFYAQLETTGNAADALVSFKTRPTSGFMASPASGATTLGTTATLTRASLLGDSPISLVLSKTGTGNTFDVSLVQGGNAIVTAAGLDLSGIAGTTIGGIGFRNFGSGTSQQLVTSDLTLDNVAVTVVPEPATMLLAMLGLTTVILLQRRRQRA